MPNNAVPAASFRLLTKALADLGVDQAHRVVAQAGLQVVGPEAGERGEHRHADHRQHQQRDADAVGRHQRVEDRRRLGRVGHGARGEHRGLLALHQVVDAEGQHRRRQQQQRDHGAALEVLLADDELEDVGGEHVEVAADHLRDAEVGDDEREGDERRRDQPVLGARQRDGEELAPRASCPSRRRPRTGARRPASAR